MAGRSLRIAGSWVLLIVLGACGGSPDPTAVLDEYRDRITARLERIEALRDTVSALPAMTEDRIDPLDPPPDLRFHFSPDEAGPGRAVCVEIEHLLETDRRSPGLDFSVADDLTVTTVATLLRDGHYPPPNEHLTLESADGDILRESLEAFLRVRYVFLVRTVELVKPFLLGTMDQPLATRKFKPGRYRGEVFVVDVEAGEVRGGFRVEVETDPSVKVSAVTYIDELHRSLGKKAGERILERTKELIPAAEVEGSVRSSR